MCVRGLNRWNAVVGLFAICGLCGCVESRGSRDALAYLDTYPASAVSPLDPTIAKSFAARSEGDPDFSKMPAPELRASFDKLMAGTPKLNEPVANMVNRKLRVGAEWSIPVRIYHPAGSGPFPILMYFHGGGWVVGTLDGYDDLCRSLCHRAGAVVVSVDYRLAPEHKYPAAAEDCYAATAWAAGHADEINGDAKRLVVMGDSAGGNLTAVVALMARDRNGPAIAAQVPIYPVTNCDYETASYHFFDSGFGLTRGMMRYFWDAYVRDAADATQPYASPLKASNLANLPPTVMITAQYDVLRDEGEAYAARLQRAGNRVRCTQYLGMTHGFINGGALYAEADRAITQVSDAVRLAGTSGAKP